MAATRIISGDAAISVDRVLNDGTPVRRMKRYAIMKGGVYYARTPSGSKERLEASTARVDNWMNSFEAMKRNGVSVKVTKNHENRMRAESVLGDVVDIKPETVNGQQWLAIEHDVMGADNIKIAQANKDVSIEIEPYMEDGKGNVYRDVISAVSYVPNPVVSGQPLAASLQTPDAVPTFYLSTESADMKDLYDAIGALVGKSDVSESNAVAYVKQHAADCQSLKMSLEEAKKPKTPDTRFLSLAARSAEGVFDSAVSAGKLTPVACDSLKAMLIGTKQGDKREFSPLALSLTATNDEGVIDLAEKLVKIIAENKPVASGEHTPAQKILMSRETPDLTLGDDKQPTRKSGLTGKEVDCKPMSA